MIYRPEKETPAPSVIEQVAHNLTEWFGCDPHQPPATWSDEPDADAQVLEHVVSRIHGLNPDRRWRAVARSMAEVFPVPGADGWELLFTRLGIDLDGEIRSLDEERELRRVFPRVLAAYRRHVAAA